MRALSVVIALTILSGISNPATARQASTCKECRDQYQRCMKNYPGKTCKVEIDICLKSCREK